MFATISLLAALFCRGIVARDMPGLRTPGNGPGQISILVYHRFDRERSGPTTVRTSVLEEQLGWLTANRRIVPLSSALAMIQRTQTFVPDAVAITVDDGHRSIFTELYPLILRYRIPVTLFVYPSAISRAEYALTWDQLREMKQSGLVDVQSHTYWHPNFRREKNHHSAEEYSALVNSQLKQSKQILEQKLGGTVHLLAWPFGIVDAELESIAEQQGYVAGFAFSGGRASTNSEAFSIPRIPVTDGDRGQRIQTMLNCSDERKEPR